MSTHAQLLRQVADLLDTLTDPPEVSITTSCRNSGDLDVTLQVSDYDAPDAGRIAAVDRIATALGLTATRKPMRDGTTHYDTGTHRVADINWSVFTACREEKK